NSGEFLNAAPSVIVSRGQKTPPATKGGNDEAPPADTESRAGSSLPLNNALIDTAIDLAKAFATHAGGIAADAWACLPDAIERLDSEKALKLMRRATNFLERGGAAALNVLIAGGDILRTLPECFDDWINLLWVVAAHGNAGLVAFIRASPASFQTITAQADRQKATQLARRVLALTGEVARIDSESSLVC